MRLLAITSTELEWAETATSPPQPECIRKPRAACFICLVSLIRLRCRGCSQHTFHGQSQSQECTVTARGTVKLQPDGQSCPRRPCRHNQARESCRTSRSDI